MDDEEVKEELKTYCRKQMENLEATFGRKLTVYDLQIEKLVALLDIHLNVFKNDYGEKFQAVSHKSEGVADHFREITDGFKELTRAVINMKANPG